MVSSFKRSSESRGNERKRFRHVRTDVVKSCLAEGARDRGALGDDLQEECVSAVHARLAAAAIDRVSALVDALSTLAISVITDRRSPRADCLVKDRADRRGEAADLARAERMRGSAGENASPKQGFIGVDIPDAREDLLIEQGGFDRGSSRMKCGAEITGRDAQGVGSQPRPALVEMRARREDPEPAETPRVAEEEMRPVVESPRRVDVVAGPVLRRDGEVKETSGHAQMDTDRPPVGGEDGELLALALQPIDRGVEQQVTASEANRSGTARGSTEPTLGICRHDRDVAPVECGLDDRSADQHRLE